ncbi:MAG: hypothetical protein WCT01_01040 [Candidatus Shapirobacteria bacterium]|jgi:hypothetical protein
MKINTNQLITWTLVTVIVSLTASVTSSVITHRLLVNQWASENQQAQILAQPNSETDEQVLAARTSAPGSSTNSGTTQGSLMAKIFGGLDNHFKQALVQIDVEESENNGNSGSSEGYLDVFQNR